MVIKTTDDLTFDPSSQSAKVGDVVEWDNAGQVPHNLTFDSGSLNDPLLNGGDHWQVRFAQPGTYSFKCTFHGGMNGTITVR